MTASRLHGISPLRPGADAGQARAPKVSVFVLTYNHADWIVDALDSVLAQEARFDFELLIADDCSTDGTRDTVREYAARHPDRIRTHLPEGNRGVEGIWLEAARHCRGEYVAILEGDDYWTSPEKLARQVALLDARPGWSSCFHRATLFHDDAGLPPRPATPGFDREVFELDDLIRSCFIPFLTVMFRREALATVPEWVFSYAWFDWLFHIYCARRGPIGFLDEDMAAYRVHDRGNWSSRGREAQLSEDLKVYERLARELPEHEALIERCVENRHCQLAVEASGVPIAMPVALLDPVADMPVYFNGRDASSLQPAGADGGTHDRMPASIHGLAERASGDGEAALHYPPHVAPRDPPPGRWCACLVPHSAGDALRGDAALSSLLRQQGEPQWSDGWCRIWEVDVDSALGTRSTDVERAGTMGALVEISEVTLAEPLPAELHDGFLDEPRPGAVLDAKVVDVLGWAIGSTADAAAVEFSIGGEPFWRAPLRAERPDLAKAFPERQEAARAGFRTTMNLIGTPPEFELGVSVVLADQHRAALATIHGRHRWRRDRSPAFAELVSVVIPCYGQAHYLGDAIESVLAQSYPHLEIVVVDDGSMDNASSIASRYPGVRCVREDNSGMAGARNVGIRSTNGDFLVFLDADDRLLPEAIEAGLRALGQRPECAAAIGTYRRTAHDGKPLPTHEQPVVDRDQYGRLMRDNWAGFPARAIYRRSLFEHVRTFDPALDAAADFGFNLAVVREFPVYSHPALVAEHREHGRNSSGDAGRMLVQTLAAMRQQRPHAKGDPDLRRDYRAGRRHWRHYYGDLLATQARHSLRERRFGNALREAALLARYRPGALPRLFGSDRSQPS
jgi:glycosyltransferase involved in cell wall biosynthesis